MPSHSNVPSLLTLFWAAWLVDAVLFDVPAKEDFLRRSSMCATVLGNYVYIDGGEISQLENGTLRDPPNYGVNSTLSIDLSKSWSTSNVSFRIIPNPGPSRGRQILWADTAAGQFYSWGGGWSHGRNMTKSQVWRFTADGSGGGSWAAESLLNPTLFDELHPGEQAAYASVNDTGFSIGGVATGWTELGRTVTQILPGMVTFNMKTKLFQNGTSNFSPFDTLVGATAQHIPFGANGLIMVLGGHAPTVPNQYGWESARPFDFRNLTFFDPVTKEAYWQISTGDIPPSPRIFFCTVGFDVPHGGYDIFLFGGSNDRDKYQYQDAYILSLPGFVWTKVPTPLTGTRHSHACVAVGNRQVLSIGGHGGFEGDWSDADPAVQGLTLFDMTTLTWKSSYYADAPPYEQAEVIKNWYQDSRQEDIQWSSERVHRLFPSLYLSSPSVEATTESPSVGAIAGGVVGGVVGVAILAAVGWALFRRRAKHRPFTPKPDDHDTVGKEVCYDGAAGRPTGPTTAEMDHDNGYSELAAFDRHRGNHLPGEPAVELGQHPVPSELPAHPSQY